MTLTRALLFVLPLAFISPALADTVTVTDDQNRSVEVNFPVQRAIVINSYGGELLRALGVDDRIVGQDKTSVDRLPYIAFDTGHRGPGCRGCS